MSDLISRKEVIKYLTEEYNRRRTADGLKLAWIEKAVNDTPSAQPELHGVCMDCFMKNVCRFNRGLGDYGYCSQWKGAEYG